MIARDNILLCVKKDPGEAPVIHLVSNDLESLQSEVGGYIETVTLPVTVSTRRGTDVQTFLVVCNEEGTINGLPRNCTVCGVEYYGPILIVAAFGDELVSVPGYGISTLMSLLFGN